jgi:putative nucleotidyltransferase with HDIG domain
MSIDLVDSAGAERTKRQIPEKLIRRMFAHIGEVSSLPAVALQIIELANNPRTGTTDLLKVVRSDPALAMRLMRTINSSYYAVNQKVADLQQAITMLGFQEVRNLALTAYVARLFQQGDESDQVLRRGMWNHMVGTAMVSRLLAEICGGIAAQEVYLGGLLHDVGLILLDEHLHKPFSRVVNALDDQASICRLEQAVFGFDHTTLGAHVAAKWHLPDQIVAAIGHHHTPEAYDGPHRAVVYMVSLADYFCGLKGVTALGVQATEKPPMQLFATLGIRKEHVSTILDRLEEVLRSADLMASVQAR